MSNQTEAVVLDAAAGTHTVVDFGQRDAAGILAARVSSGHTIIIERISGEFEHPIDRVRADVDELLELLQSKGLVTTAPPKDRDIVVAKARARAARRYAELPASA